MCEGRMTVFFDLFAGIGGFRLALERLGWKCIGYCENDKYSLQTYRKNFTADGEWFWDDATTMPTDKMPDFDILCAGFPCQAFSVAGNRKGFDDSRGTLVYHIFRVLEAKKPKAFILENVKGLVCKPFRNREFRYILMKLNELGYRAFWRVLNSKDFGVPQNRERVFIVGFRGNGSLGNEFVYPKGRPLEKRLKDVLEENADPKYNLSEKMVKCLMKHLERHKEKGHGFGMSVKDPESVSSSLVIGGQGRERNLVANTLSARYHKDGSENLIKIIDGGNTPKGQQDERVYDEKGVSPTIPCQERNQIKVMIGETAYTKGNMKKRLREGDVMWNIVGANSKAVGLKQIGNIGDNLMGHRVYSTYGLACATRSEGGGQGGKTGLYITYHAHDVAKGEKSKRWGKYVKGNQEVSPALDSSASWGINLRRLTPRECARLQGFPDDFKIPVSDTQAYREFGNAVTVNVVEELGRRVEKWIT